jgi:antitoxin MazE
MKSIHVGIRQIGNSQEIVIHNLDGGALGLPRPAGPARNGWSEAVRKLAESGDDALVMGEFDNAADAELAW